MPKTTRKKRDSAPMPAAASDFLLYAAPDGAVKVRILFKDEPAWLTQEALAELFGVGVPAVNKHLKNIFESGELSEDSVVSILETTAADGKAYSTRFHNLDAIIAVGYRVNSYQATQFRIWATKTLREFIIKGFVLDDERLKQGKTAFGKDYFDELLERIREIRASERRFYQKITERDKIPSTSRISIASCSRRSDSKASRGQARVVQGSEKRRSDEQDWYDEFHRVQHHLLKDLR